MADHSLLQPARDRHPHVRRSLLAATASLSALVTFVAGIGMGAYFWTRSQISTIPDLGPPAVSPGAAAPEPDIAGKCDEQACNYLLLGSDSRAGLSKEEQEHFGTNEDIGGENRSDTIILIHVDPREEQAVFLSFPRDLWVEIPGLGYGRINSAFRGGIEGGGAQLVAHTVRNLTGLRINHVLYVDLAGFQGLVDALGGVDMCVPYPMRDELTGLDIPAGCQRFDGDTALAYVRTRHQPCDRVPDFARIARQQQFLRAVIAKLLSPAMILRLPSLVPALLENLVVDKGLRNPAELAYLAGQLNGVNTGAADFRAVPGVPAGVYVDGQFLSVVRMLPEAEELFGRLGEGLPLGHLGKELPSTPPSPANIVLAVYDKESFGTAFGVLTLLMRGGFDTSPGLVDADVLGMKVKGSAILFSPGEEAKADVLGSYLPTLERLAVPRRLLGGADVGVVVSSRFTPPSPGSEPPSSTVECP